MYIYIYYILYFSHHFCFFSRFANAAAPTFGQLAQSPTSSGFGDGQSSAGFGAPQAPSSPFGGTPSSAGFGGFGQTPSSPGFGGAQPQGEDMGHVRSTLSMQFDSN